MKSLIISLLALAPAFAQVQTTFTTSSGAGQAVFNGSKVSLSAPGVGVSATAVVTIRNGSAAAITLSDAGISGAGFSATLPSLPATLPPLSVVSVPVTYTPSSGASVSGVFRISTASEQIAFTILGTAPDLVFSLVRADGTVTALGGSATLFNFGPVRVNTAAVATLRATNRGGGVGTVESIGGTGGGFTADPVADLPVPPGATLSWSVRFTPTVRGPANGTLQIRFAGQLLDVALAGSGAVSDLTVSYITPDDNNAYALTSGRVIVFPPTAVNATSTLTFTIANRGDLDGTVTGISVSGLYFRLANLPLVPVTVQAGATVQFAVRYSPLQAGTSAGVITVTLADRTIEATLSGPTAVPRFRVAWGQIDTNVATSISDGGLVPFRQVAVNTTAVLALILSNMGEGPGDLEGVQLTGSDAFSLANLPVLPVTVPPKNEFRLNLRFTPRRAGYERAEILLTISGATVRLGVDGTGTAATLSYEITSPDLTVTAFLPNGRVTLPDTRLGDNSPMELRIRNTGNADATISSISVTGPAFSIPDPPLLPLVITAGASTAFILRFQPAEPGEISGRLRIGEAVFDLVGRGLGSKLRYSFGVSSPDTAVIENGAVLFSPAIVGQSSTLLFSVRNEGTSAAIVNTLGIVQGVSVYTVDIPQPMPFTLQPGASLNFPLRFSPASTGISQGVLQLNGVTFQLLGQAMMPPPLPALRFTGASGTQKAGAQPVFALELSAPYSQQLEGTLTLSVDSQSFAPDPAVQFATGGRSVPFVIRAGSTAAEFPGGTRSMALQTGTVATAISITPSLGLAGGVVLTPANPPTLSYTVERAAPQLLSVQISDSTQSAVQLQITALATTRSVGRITLELSPAPGIVLSNPRQTINTEVSAGLWYRSAASTAFGGQVTIVVPVSVNVSGNTRINDLIRSIAVTLGNETGDSNSLSVSLP